MSLGDDAIAVLREVLAGLVRRDGPLLTSHQLAVYLTCYVQDRDHTVRGLAGDLKVSKSVITRSLDRLSELGLARRRIDPSDRRSIIVERTPRGEALLSEMRAYGTGAPHDRALSATTSGFVDMSPSG
ncbi:MAG TPA: MarR family winged helix-turn-helix transcriptional regulator [Acetobacteraceae bacterium]|jgi:DNA-binding MarR family transcriptional regulator|nr:MarR family winged helix-turn-helix transcriptional regulator [Acetobacteraceae bacterium]